MVHGDPQQRSARLAEVTEILKREAQPEERELLLSLAPILFAGMPARLALDLPAPAVAARVLLHFRFVAREMPPAPPALQGPARDPRLGPQPQRGRGPRPRRRGGAAARDHDRRDPHPGPALHLRQPQELPAEVRPAGVLGDPPHLHRAPPVGADRVARRPAGGGQPRELLLLPDRARRLAGAGPAGRARGLLAAEGGLPGGRRLRGHGARVPGARAAPPEPPRATPPSSPPPAPSWSGCSTTTTSSWAPSRYARGARRDGEPGGRDRERASSPTPRCSRSSSPASSSTSRRTCTPQAGDDRIVDLDFCTNATAIYHLEPIEDLTVREWGEDGTLAGSRCCSAASPAAPSRSGPTASRSSRRSTTGCSSRAGPSRAPTSGARSAPPSTTSPRPSSSTRTRPTSKRMIDRIVARGERRRDRGRGPHGGGYEALYVAFSRLRYSYQIEAALRRALRATRSGRWRSRRRSTAGRSPSSSSTSTRTQLEHPVDLEEARRLAEPLVTDWEDHVGAALERDVRRARGPAAVPPLRDAGVAQRPLPRGDGARSRCRTTSRKLEALEGRLEAGRRAEDVGDGLRCSSTRCAPSTSPTS